MPISVAIVEDNLEICEMLTRTITREPGLVFMQSFASGEEALERLPALAPNVVIMDVQLPGISGVECTSRLRRLAPDIQVLVFTVFGDSELVFKALEAGASGYLLKRTPRKEIVAAVRDVWFGGAPMTGGIARKVVEYFRKPARSRSPELEDLTPREAEVLAALAKGYVTKEIADEMGVSADTVRFHLKNIYQKLHVRSRTEALLKYMQ